ncbi:MAG TPA: hypothetical protein VGS28_03500 [Candidatus Saccharimonadales bacterium]|nr:hypothetical protein [Candidatus Saccharimonadales bacterium]
MSENRLTRIYEYLKEAQLSLGVCALMAVTNALDRSGAGMMVYANSPLSEQAIRALPSALPTPVTTGNLPVDIAIQAAETFVTAEVARRTSSAKQLLGGAVAAQVLSCSVDAAVERTGWLNAAERMQPDVGFSAISAAWLTKFFLDRAERAKTPLRKGLWRLGMAAYAGTITLGYYFMDRASGGKLDLTSHASGIAVGVAMHALGKQPDNHAYTSEPTNSIGNGV